MKVCFFLHFYQPSNQFGHIIKKVATESYLPLVRLLKNSKKFSITANIPLSLLEQLEREGYSQLISDIRDLVNTGRIELVGSAAYHPLLTKIPQDMSDKQVVLNEMSLGYYFGSTKDFEGEDCFMIKNIQGFFPPEMAVSDSVIDRVSDLGYDWMLSDVYCLPQGIREKHKAGNCYAVKNKNLKLIIRDRELTNKISFVRSLDHLHIVESIISSGDLNVIALDAETFGHHYADGIYLLESMISELQRRGVETSTITQAFEQQDVLEIPNIEESTWSTVDDHKYPLWENSSNPINCSLWNLMEKVHGEYINSSPDPVMYDENCIPLWKQKDAAKDPFLNLLRSEQSDQFWWSTGRDIMGKINYSKYMVSSVLDYYKAVINTFDQPEELLHDVTSIESMLTDDRNL